MRLDAGRAALALRPRERRLALVALVVIGCWAFVSWLVQPLWARLRTLQRRVEAQTERLDALSRLLAQAPLVERAYASAAPYLAVRDAEEDQRAFLHELETLSRQSSVQLNLKPRSLKGEERLSRFEVELDLEGAQAQVLTFLDALFRMPRLMTIERLRFFTAPANPQVLRANLLLHALSLRE